jgi:hypothetical protein
MDWHEHFGAVFFETWRKTGLPHHLDFTDEYIEARSGRDFKNSWIQQPYEFSPALDDNILRSVYGFGALHGTLFCELFNLNEAVLKEASDWCGRFNLGISLFDYLCDEVIDSPNGVLPLKVFQPFIKTKITEIKPLTPTEEFLSNLASSVLQDLEKLNFKNEELKKSNHLLKLMKQLFEAQSFLSKEGLSDTADLDKIKKALYLKSAEPFKVMAEYTLGLSHTNDALLLKNVRSIGKAFGYCYWLIDDAKDVWIDLEAGQWNLFLQIAAKEDPHIFSENRYASLISSITNTLIKGNHAEKISEEVVKRLLMAINALELSEKVREHTLGLLSASLWYWYQ